MNKSIDLDPIFALPVPQRIGIVQAILDSIADENRRPQLSKEFETELVRRDEEAEANPEADIPWEVVQAEALKRIGRP